MALSFGAKTTSEKFDVAIVGGGIAGCASAYYLAKKGLSVVVFEKGEIAGEQSSRNLGFVRQQGRDPSEIPLMLESKRLWRGLQQELQADLEWREGGVLYVAESAESIQGYERWMVQARLHQLDSRILTSGEVSEVLPGMSKRWLGGLFTRSDGQANPLRTTRAFSEAAQRLGVVFATNCIVEKLDVSGGRIRGVATEFGLVEAAAVLVAGGAWSSRLLRLSGAGFPQLAVRSTVLRTKPIEKLTEVSFWGPRFGFRQRPDGAVIIGAGVRCDHEVSLDSLLYARYFWNAFGVQRDKVDLQFDPSRVKDLRRLVAPQMSLRAELRSNRVLSPAAVENRVQRAFGGFRELFPDLHLEIDESWAGMIDVTPDELPVLGPVRKIDGLFVATGFSGHGFGIGPAAGLTAAQMIADGRTSVDVKAFSIERFR